MLADLIEYYKAPPDFDKLAADVPAFKPYVIRTASGFPTVDFQSNDAIRALTLALLNRDFDLQLFLPNDRLCPMIPGRYEYVCWIVKLMASTLSDVNDRGTFTGIDIGSGSSAIYSLLATRSLASLKMITTEIDDRSLKFAKRNIELNHLENRISLLEVAESGSLLPPQVFNGHESIDFTMCNPPFYSGEEEIASALERKVFDPHAVCTGSYTEMVTPGGEIAFVLRLVNESLSLGSKIRWFSSLLGKHSSVRSILVKFKEFKIDNFAVHESYQGRTKRWMVAWSLQADRPPNSVTCYESPVISQFQPFAKRPLLRYTASASISDVRRSVLIALKDANLSGVLIDSGALKLTAYEQSWSRTSRRKRARGEEEKEKGILDDRFSDQNLAIEPTFVAILEITLEEDGRVELQVNMISGLEHTPFLTFWSYLTSQRGMLLVKVV